MRALSLESLALDPPLARAVGEWKGAPVTIETTAWRGPLVRYARVATVRGAGLEIGNVLVLPRHDVPLPMLGADLVSLGARGAGTMIAADLSPVLPQGVEQDAQLGGLARRMASFRDLTSGGELPAWCARWFSPHALYVRPSPDELPRAAQAFREVVAEYIALASDAARSAVMSEEIMAAQAGYAVSHREDDRGLGMLGRMFGQRWADRYLRLVLFPDD